MYPIPNIINLNGNKYSHVSSKNANDENYSTPVDVGPLKSKSDVYTVTSVYDSIRLRQELDELLRDIVDSYEEQGDVDGCKSDSLKEWNTCGSTKSLGKDEVGSTENSQKSTDDSMMSKWTLLSKSLSTRFMSMFSDNNKPAGFDSSLDIDKQFRELDDYDGRLANSIIKSRKPFQPMDDILYIENP